jgi:hypothetical protein
MTNEDHLIGSSYFIDPIIEENLSKLQYLNKLTK